MEDNEYKVPKDIIDLAEKLVDLYKIAYNQIKPEVLYILNRNVRNVRYIEEVLDRLFDIPTDEAYDLFMLLCEYYMTIDKESAQFYIDSYEEIYGEEDYKTKKRL